MRMGVMWRALELRWSRSMQRDGWLARWHFGLLLALMVGYVLPSMAATAPPEAPSDRVVFSEAPVIRFQGMHSSRTFPFYVSPAWNLSQPGRLHLQMSVSELVRASSLTVRINGLELRSIPLGDKQSVTVSSDVPRESLVAGWNVLELSFYLRSGNEPCRDVDNPGLWVLLKPESGFSFPHTLKEVVPDLAGFPAAYSVPEGPRQAPSVLIALTPQSAGLAPALEVAGLLATRLGQARTLRAGSLKGHLVRAVTGGQQATRLNADRLESSHHIFVGLSSELAALQTPDWNGAEVLAAFEAAQVGPGEAWLMEQRSPLNPFKRQAFVLAKEAVGLERAAWALRTGESRAWTGRAIRLARLASQGMAEADAAATAPTIPLLEEGKELTLRGLTRPDGTASLAVPRHWMLDPSAQLTLVLQTGLSLQRRGMLEVLLNDRPLASVDLIAGPAGQESQAVHLKLPIDANSDGTVRFGFKLFLDLPEGDCSRTFDESAWVRILTDSSLNLPHTSAQVLNISDWPDRFAEDASLRGTGLILGRQEAQAQGNDGTLEVMGFTTFLTAASGLGARQPRAEQLWLKFLPQTEFEAHNEALESDTQWIVIASKLQGKLSELVTQRWPTGVDRDDRLVLANLVKPATLEPESAEGRGKGSEWAGPAGVLFHARSPWNPEGSYLLASELEPPGMQKTAHFFEQLWYDKNLSGDLLILRDVPPPLLLRVDSGTDGRAASDDQGGGAHRWYLLALSLGSLGLAGLLYRTIWQQGLKRRR